MAFWSEDFSTNIKDPKRKFRFSVSFTNIRTAEGGPVLWYAKTAAKPGFTISETVHEYLNHKFYYPGRTEWDTVDITVVDPADPDISATLSDIVVQAGYSPAANAFELDSMSKSGAVQGLGNVLIQQLDSDGTPIEEWTLWNAFVTALKFGDLDYSSDELSEITITLRYDWARLETASPSVHSTGGGTQFFNP